MTHYDLDVEGTQEPEWTSATGMTLAMGIELIYDGGA